MREDETTRAGEELEPIVRIRFSCDHVVLYPIDWELRAKAAKREEHAKYWRDQSMPSSIMGHASCPACKGPRGEHQRVYGVEIATEGRLI